MIAAMTAAVSTVSTLRLVSVPRAGLSVTLALTGLNPADGPGMGTGAGACAAGPLKATGCVIPPDEAIAATGALLTRAS
jgi:hypothetical protein